MLNDILRKTILIMHNILAGIFQKEYKECKETPQKFQLKFNPNRQFKLVQFTDLHERPLKNEKTMRFVENILNLERPDLVVLTGDNIYSRYCSKEDIKKTIDNIARPMEDRKIPWAVAFGNHDSEFCELSRRSQMKMYMSYNHNLSRDFSSVNGRSGDYNLLINDSKNNKPVFNIYMLDSGSYCFFGYGYIKTKQINWYRILSGSLKRKFGRKIPSFMFFHIPLQQHHMAWTNGKAKGSRNEAECTQKIDRGLFSTLLEMGDVRGVFVGHDHTNDYFGSVNGITLGYGRNTGHNGYAGKDFIRGARVFILNENRPERFKTYEILE